MAKDDAASIGIRKSSKTKEKLIRLAKLMSDEIGIPVRMADAVDIAIKEAIETRMKKKRRARK